MGEFGFSIEKASLCFTCASLAFVTCSPINGAIGDKIPKHTMKRMIITVSWLRVILLLCAFALLLLPLLPLHTLYQPFQQRSCLSIYATLR